MMDATGVPGKRLIAFLIFGNRHSIYEEAAVVIGFACKQSGNRRLNHHVRNAILRQFDVQLSFRTLRHEDGQVRVIEAARDFASSSSSASLRLASSSARSFFLASMALFNSFWLTSRLGATHVKASRQ